MIADDRRHIPDRRTPTTHWSPEEVRILRLIADIQLDLSECTTQEERDALYLELREATAQCTQLVNMPTSSNLEEKEGVKNTMNLLKELAIQGWTITIVFVDGFYVDFTKKTEKYSSFHAQDLHLAIIGLFSKLPNIAFQQENLPETHKNADTPIYKGEVKVSKELSGVYCERCREEVGVERGFSYEWLVCHCSTRRNKVEESPLYWKEMSVVGVIYGEQAINAVLDEVETTDLYWDCECKENYIHKKEEFYCILCDSYASDQPDSRVNEVKAAGLPLE